MPNPRGVNWKPVFLLVLATAAVFANCLKNGFAWDDDEFVLRNAHLTSAAGLPEVMTNHITAGAGQTSNFYRPVQGLTHFVDVQLWGTGKESAPGHHFTNAVLHVALALALLRLLTSMFAPWPAFFGALLFAIHPLQSEAAAYVSGRGDTLGMLFVCLGLLAFERRYALSLVCAALALGAKESMVVFPALLVLHQWLRGKPIDTRRHTPFWGLSALYVWARLTVLDFDNTLNFVGHADHPMTSPITRVLTYLTTLPGGLRLWLWPSDLHHERSWPIVDSPTLEVWASLAGILVLGLVAWRTRRAFSALAVGLAWFLVSTSPTSNLVAVINTVFYDHWFLLPGIGLCLIVAQALDRLWRHRTGRAVACTASVCAAGVFAWLTPHYNAVWENDISLNEHILRYEADSDRAGKIRLNLGKGYSQRGELDLAAAEYEWVIANGYQYAQTHHNLGSIYAVQGKYALAREQLELALHVDPQFHPALEMLGRVSVQQGRIEEALGFFDRALRIYPDFAEAYLGKARCLLRKNNPRGALAELERGLRRLPGHPALRAEIEKIKSAFGG